MSPCRLALLLLGFASAAHAQTVPFGKNKIQYRSFQWQVLAGEHIDVYYYAEEEPLARLTLAYAEESFGILERKFQHHPFDRIPLIVYSSHHHFEQTNIFSGFIPEGVLGFTEYLKRRVALPFRGDYAQFRQTLRHELVHAFQLSKIAEVQALHPGRRRFTPQQVHWWTEGLAEFWSSEQTTEDAMFNQDLVLNGRLPNVREFGRQASYASYPLGAELHRYLADRFGEGYIVRVYEEFWKHGSFDETLEAVLGVDLDRLGRDWTYELQQRYFPIYGVRSPPEVAAVPLIYGAGGGFKPILYVPPGDTAAHLFFLSPRSGYMNIYRTTLAAGERGVETVVEGERTAEFESLHAYESRIDIHASGRIAFASRYLERDALFLWDLRAGRVVGRYQWPDLVGIRSPAWDPTGSRIVFEGLSTGGFSDLYVIDFRTQLRSRLTADRYRDQDPDWSPDGRTIVFASDRTTLGAEGHSNLFLLDVASGAIRYLTYGAWIDRDPRWSRAGDRIAFSSDRDGAFDLYAIDAAGNGRRLTGMAGGAFDPTWLPGDQGLVFTGYSEGTYRIYRFTFAEDTATHPAVMLVAPADTPAPMSGGGSGARPTSMGWEWTELDAPALADADTRSYASWRQISLDAAGGDSFLAPGLGAAQGAQFLATDMLGNHILFAGVSAVQARSLGQFFDNFSGNLFYLNLSNRLNFGAGIFRFKGLFRDVALDLYEDRSLGGFAIASYPFSRFTRVELQLGLEWSDRGDVENGFGGILDPPAPTEVQDLTRSGVLTSNYLSYVKDNTLWTSTGPIDGERYNLTAGFVSCFSCTRPGEITGELLTRLAIAESYVLSGDYRRYLRTSHLTAYAIRLAGFYSDGAIPARSVLGGPHQLRGYPRFSMAGSRLLLLNQEWRFPLLHSLGLGFPFGEIRIPGIQGAVFIDIGSSWLKDRSPRGAWGSWGLGLRAPIGPPLVLRADIGRRFRSGELPPALFGTGRRFDDTFVDFFFGFNY